MVARLRHGGACLLQLGDVRTFRSARRICRARGALPHWYQAGVTYFVTFRTEDSVPQPLVRSWHRKRDDWLARRGIDPWATDWKRGCGRRRNWSANITRCSRNRTWSIWIAGMERASCASRRCPRLLPIHFGTSTASDIILAILSSCQTMCTCSFAYWVQRKSKLSARSWKKYSAGEINDRLGRRGRFWQEESFDHLVRSAEQFEHLKRYITTNPERARLKPGEYLHWVRPM